MKGRSIKVLILSLLFTIILISWVSAVSIDTTGAVQVLPPSTVNISSTESAWLPSQIQDKLKSNLQEYLNLRIVVDASAEKSLKKLQSDSESGARDANTAIELGKITTAKYGLFSKIRKTGFGYTLSVDYTDLTTGIQVASATSKEYSKVEYLYGTTGAVDEVTLSLANKLGIKLNNLTKNLLLSGSADFSIDNQLALSKQNEEQYQKLMKQYEDELKKLSTSNDLSSVENKKKIEAEKALLVEKQKTEQKRLAELTVQKEKTEADAKLESERSIEMRTRRDNLAKQAEVRAEQVRKLKLERQGVLGQINVIENKKKALLDIRQAVEDRCVELGIQAVEDIKTEEERIRSAPWSLIELNNGQPTSAAKQRREAKVAVRNANLHDKFFADCEAVQKAASWQDSSLLAEIRKDQKTLEKTRTVSSLSDEFKVSYGLYDGSRNGWVTYLRLYSEGVLLYSDSFLLGYDVLTGKKAPDLAKEMNDLIIDEYANTVDMYNSLFTRGDPILYYELDYTVKAENDDKPSQYVFTFNKIKAIDTITGKNIQTVNLAKVQSKAMTPVRDLRIFAGVVEKEKAKYDSAKYPIEYYMVSKNLSRSDAMDLILKETIAAAEAAEAEAKAKANVIKLIKTAKFIKIPGKNFEMLNTEVTQELYKAVMGNNPSCFKGDNLPVERVSWYDAVEFCNALSEKLDLHQVYSIEGKLSKNYYPTVVENTQKNGFRLPTKEEWEYAAKGGRNNTYAGSNNLNEVGWFDGNSDQKTHPVSQKKPNSYGLYDMSGNVWEWCFNYNQNYYSTQDPPHAIRAIRGGSYYGAPHFSELTHKNYINSYTRSKDIGFRIVRNIK